MDTTIIQLWLSNCDFERGVRGMNYWESLKRYRLKTGEVDSKSIFETFTSYEKAKNRALALGLSEKDVMDMKHIKAIFTNDSGKIKPLFGR